MAKTIYTEFLTKNAFLAIRANAREKLQQINTEIKFIKAHKKKDKAAALKADPQLLASIYKKYFNEYHAPHETLYTYYTNTLRPEANRLHLLLGLLNGTPIEKLGQAKDMKTNHLIDLVTRELHKVEKEQKIMKTANFKLQIADDDLFTVEATKIMRAKISELMRSEFDRMVKEECERVISSRLLSRYADNPLGQMARELTAKWATKDWNNEWHENNPHGGPMNPVLQGINNAFSDHWHQISTKHFEQNVKEEVEKQVKEKLKAIREAMNA
jgi:hypothetical protein